MAQRQNSSRRPWRGILLLGFFVLFSAGFAFMCVADWYSDYQTRSWAVVSCKILSSRVGNVARGSNQEYTPDVRYEYQYAGKAYRGYEFYWPHRFNGGEYSGQNYNIMAGLAGRYHPGDSATCYVNPAQPQQAVLERRNDYGMLVIALIVPGFFVFFYFAFYRPPKPKRYDVAAKPISALAKKRDPRTTGLVIGVLFTMLSALLYVSTTMPAREIATTKNWRATPCLILESHLDQNSYKDGNTYTVNVLFSYQVNGREYRSNHYQAGRQESSSYHRQAERASHYVPGQTSTCYVNPDSPSEAVLNTTYEPDASLLSYVPFVMMAMGLLLTVSSAAKFIAPKSRLAVMDNEELGDLFFGRTQRRTLNERGGITFQSRAGSPFRLIGLMLGVFAGFALIASIVRSIILDWRLGAISLDVMTILVPLVAVVGIGWCFKQLWQALAPQPTVTVFPDSVAPGESFTVDWEFRESVRPLTELKIIFQGREDYIVKTTHVGPHGGGVEKIVHKVPFHEVPLLVAGANEVTKFGSASVKVPDRSMHSFETPSCRVLWCLIITGKIKSGTVIQHEFKLTVLPAKETAP